MARVTNTYWNKKIPRPAFALPRTSSPCSHQDRVQLLPLLPPCVAMSCLVPRGAKLKINVLLMPFAFFTTLSHQEGRGREQQIAQYFVEVVGYPIFQYNRGGKRWDKNVIAKMRISCSVSVASFVFVSVSIRFKWCCLEFPNDTIITSDILKDWHHNSVNYFSTNSASKCDMKC